MSEDFCGRLVAALEARNISRNELVRLGYPGLSYRKVHAYCSGESQPPLEFLVLLGQMGFDLHDLLLGQPHIAASAIAAPAGATAAVWLPQLEAALRATHSALAKMAAPPPALPAIASGEPVALSQQEQHIITLLRSMPERQEVILAMLTPCPRCTAQADAAG